LPGSRIRRIWPNTDPVTKALASLSDVASGYDAIVFDQWGVLHDGSAPSSAAVAALTELKARGHMLAVLTNSGRRAAPNAARLTALGFPPDLFDCVMSSGEALWHEFAAHRTAFTRLHAITSRPDDAIDWAAGLEVNFVPIEEAEAVLLMGVADDALPGAYDGVFAVALERGLPVLCSNPDRTAPRPGGAIVVMPGMLAHDHANAGGEVRYVGKPHVPIFRAVEAALDLPPERVLMVGDSLEHDIAGAAAAGWDSVFICGGLHAQSFRSGEVGETVAELARSMDTPLPEFTLETVR